MAEAARILLVDDLADVRESTAALLEAAGYFVVAAADGAEALALLAGDPAVDLLITDIVLASRPNGFELAQQALQRRPALKVLYTTGYAWNLEDAHAAVPGSRMLRKPYRAAELLREVDGLLDAPAPLLAAPGRTPQPHATPKPAILVVEDDARSRAIAVDLFQGLGLTVISAGDAEEALVELARHPEIATLFTDIRLPGMSGSELATAARKLRPELTIVLTSAYMDATPLPGASFIPKPWRTQDFTLVAGTVTRH